MYFDLLIKKRPSCFRFQREWKGSCFVIKEVFICTERGSISFLQKGITRKCAGWKKKKKHFRFSLSLSLFFLETGSHASLPTRLVSKLPSSSDPPASIQVAGIKGSSCLASKTFIMKHEIYLISSNAWVPPSLFS